MHVGAQGVKQFLVELAARAGEIFQPLWVQRHRHTVQLRVEPVVEVALVAGGDEFFFLPDGHQHVVVVGILRHDPARYVVELDITHRRHGDYVRCWFRRLCPKDRATPPVCHKQDNRQHPGKGQNRANDCQFESPVHR